MGSKAGTLVQIATSKRVVPYSGRGNCGEQVVEDRDYRRIHLGSVCTEQLQTRTTSTGGTRWLGVPNCERKGWTRVEIVQPREHRLSARGRISRVDEGPESSVM